LHRRERFVLGKRCGEQGIDGGALGVSVEQEAHSIARQQRQITAVAHKQEGSGRKLNEGSRDRGQVDCACALNVERDEDARCRRLEGPSQVRVHPPQSMLSQENLRDRLCVLGTRWQALHGHTA
jgi:hypothetical protein